MLIRARVCDFMQVTNTTAMMDRLTSSSIIMMPASLLTDKTNDGHRLDIYGMHKLTEYEALLSENAEISLCVSLSNHGRRDKIWNLDPDINIL
jgi:hypothetical protein